MIGKVKLPLCLTKHRSMKTYWGSGGIAPRNLTSALDGGEWSASRPGRFCTRERAPWYPLVRGLGGPQSRSERGGEEKNSELSPGIELRTQSLYRLSYAGC
jgi:hypothetical protein